MLVAFLFLNSSHRFDPCLLQEGFQALGQTAVIVRWHGRIQMMLQVIGQLQEEAGDNTAAQGISLEAARFNCVNIHN